MSDLERARAQRPTITCAHCGGHDFVVTIVNLAGNSELQCVRYAEHVEELGLAEERQRQAANRRESMRQRLISQGLDPDEIDLT